MKSQFSTITKQSTFVRVWSLHLIGHQPWIPSLVVLRILTEKAFHSIVARWAYSKFKERSALGVLAHISYYYKNGSLTEAHVCTLFLCRTNRRSNLKKYFWLQFWTYRGLYGNCRSWLGIRISYSIVGNFENYGMSAGHVLSSLSFTLFLK